jgi:hypothetical protein
VEHVIDKVKTKTHTEQIKELVNWFIFFYCNFLF